MAAIDLATLNVKFEVKLTIFFTCVTLKLIGWHWKRIGHLSYGPSKLCASFHSNLLNLNWSHCPKTQGQIGDFLACVTLNLMDDLELMAPNRQFCYTYSIKLTHTHHISFMILQSCLFLALPGYFWSPAELWTGLTPWDSLSRIRSLLVLDVGKHWEIERYVIQIACPHKMNVMQAGGGGGGGGGLKMLMSS